MLEVGGRTEVWERRRCLVSHLKMCWSFQRPEVIEVMVGQG